MAVVIGIHGIWQGRTDADRLSRAWTAALAEGLAAAGSPHRVEVAVAWLTPLLTAPELHLSGSDEDAVAGLTDADEPELAFLASALADALNDLDQVEVESLEEAGQTLVGIPSVPAVLGGRIAAADGRWPGAGPLLVRVLREVYAYLFRPEIGYQVRRRVVTAAPTGAEVVLAHSLGSVVAYDLLRRGELLDIRHLVTFGSPLAWPTVHRALVDSWPQAVPGRTDTPGGLTDVGWVNVWDRRDPVTAHRPLGPVWPAVVDHEVSNPRFDAHGAGRYLRQRGTAEAVDRALT